MPSKKHNFTVAEIKAGLFVLVSLAVLAGFIAIIQGMRPEGESDRYFATFTNTIGLREGAEVRFGGMLVGRVGEITPDPENQTRLRVTAEVTPGTPVNAASVATVNQLTLTSDKHLEISTGNQDAALLEAGTVLQSVTTSGEFIDIPDVTGVVNRVENLLDDVIAFLGVDEAEQLEASGGEEFAKLSRVTADVRETLNQGTGLVTDIRGTLDEQKPNIEATFEKIHGIQDSANDLIGDLDAMLAENRAPLNEAVSGVADTVEGAQALMADAQGIVKQVGGVVDGVADRLDTLVAALEGTLVNAEALSGEARTFLELNRPAIEDLLGDLRDTVRNLREFTRVLADQPNAVLRGRAPQGRQE